MNLRELIDRLEDISRYGKNDHLPVTAYGDDGMIDMDVVDVRVDLFSTSNEEYNFVRLDLK